MIIMVALSSLYYSSSSSSSVTVQQCGSGTKCTGTTGKHGVCYGICVGTQTHSLPESKIKQKNS